MLFTKRKISVSLPFSASSGEASGARPSEPGRALDALGTLLKAYARYAFDTERSAADIRQQCEAWAQRIVLGEPRPKGPAAEPEAEANPEAQAEAKPVLRDWHGLERFFTELREHEGAFVVRSMNGLRKIVFEFARFLGSSAGEDQDLDAQVEERLDALSRALVVGQVSDISKAATVVIDTARAAMARRREREAHHVATLGKELRKLQDEVACDTTAAGTDPVTGLFSRTAYEQHLEQLGGIGMLLDPRPWLLVIAPELPKRSGPAPARLTDDKLREASKCVNRTFLRRQDFVARSGVAEFSVLLADMTREQVSAAADRLLNAARDLARGARRSEGLTFSIGMAQLRPNEDTARWRARAEVALGRAKEDGGDGFQIA
jgi:GGDEF domain-containing protein